jgi:hypothetical protein
MPTIGWPSGPITGAGRLGVGARIGRFEVDDVAQEDLAIVDLVAPDDDGLEGERLRRGPRRASRPASMRLAMAISPSRERSSTEPISRRSCARVVGALGGSLAPDLAGTGAGTSTSSFCPRFLVRLLAVAALPQARPPWSRPR